MPRCSSYGGKCISGICLFLDFQNYAENSYHVVTYSTANADAILDGFTVRSGAATGSGAAAQNQGSAVHIRRADLVCSGGDDAGDSCVDNDDCTNGGTCGIAKCIAGGPTLKNCIFKQDLSTHHGAVNDHSFATVITDCSFIDNLSSASTADAGGLQIHSGSPTVTGCTFTDNRSGENGAAVWGGHDTNADTTCTGGAATSAPSFTDCTFDDNISKKKGGAIYSEDGDPTITECTFDSNTSLGSAGRFTATMAIQQLPIAFSWTMKPWGVKEGESTWRPAIP